MFGRSEQQLIGVINETKIEKQYVFVVRSNRIEIERTAARVRITPEYRVQKFYLLRSFSSAVIIFFTTRRFFPSTSFRRNADIVPIVNGNRNERPR